MTPVGPANAGRQPSPTNSSSADRVDAPRRATPGRPLTSREHMMMAYVAHGLTNAEIAARMGLTENGVKSALKRVHIKLGLHGRIGLSGRAGLIAWWWQEGIQPGAVLPGGMVAVSVQEYRLLLDCAEQALRGKPLPAATAARKAREARAGGRHLRAAS